MAYRKIMNLLCPLNPNGSMHAVLEQWHLFIAVYRSRRGGSWSAFAENCRSAFRSFGNPVERYDDTGLRLCLAATR